MLFWCLLNIYAMRKITILILFALVLTFKPLLAKEYGSMYYSGPMIKQDYGTWCVFASMEMMPFASDVQCVYATHYAQDYLGLSSSQGCCVTTFPGDSFFKCVLNNGVDVRNFEAFVSKYYEPISPGGEVKARYSNDQEELKPYPCLGVINDMTHCVLVYGVEAGFDYNGKRRWTVLYVDPVLGGRTSITLTNDSGERVFLFFRQ